MAFYTNSLNFANLTVKGAPIGADSILLADSAAGGLPKQALLSTLPFAPLAGGAIVDVTAATQQLAGDTVYIVDYVSGVCTLTLPTAVNSIQGQFIIIMGGTSASNPFVIAQNALQQIRAANQLTTAGVGGTLTAAYAAGSNITLRCESLSNGLIWQVVSETGSFAGV